MSHDKSRSYDERRVCANERVGLAFTGLPLVEPEQTCEACGAAGTVGRVVINSRDRTRQEIHRFCERCWPEEAARYEARWKDRRATTANELFATEHEAREAPTTGSLFEQNPMNVGMGFESATWHAAADAVEKLEELLQMVRSGRVPTEADLIEMALATARDIEAQMDTRVGKMPFSVAQFLIEFGSASDAARATQRTGSRATSTVNKSSESLDDAIAAAHASADAVIAEFDNALETLAKPTTPESRNAIEKELVEILQQLEQEITSEAAALDSWQSEMKTAAKSGDVYTAMKLSRLGDDRVVRLHGLRETMEEVEHLHARLLGGEGQAES